MSIYQDFNTIPSLPMELDFEPVREPVVRTSRDGIVRTVPNSFWIVNPVSDTVMTTSKKHHRTPNFSDMWEAFREGLLASDVDTSGVKVKFNVAHNCAAYSADILFPKYDYQRIVGEATQMKMRVIDSHDSTFSRVMRALIERLKCTNGMVGVGEKLEFKNFHTVNSDPEKLGAVASEFPTRLENEAHLYKVMMGTRVSKDNAIAFARAEVATYQTATGMKVNEKSVEEFARLWNQYSSLGDTGYRLYNVLTHIGTHVTGREGTDLARKQIRIEDKIADIVQRPAFRQISGLAQAA